ncbi:methyltransferase domain-containing protein [Cohnella nanjingensis]|uniref:Methyltransferase domain-containing protein n=1 Tax=Cohnella nanjingensis TaxID=1387779 RepID=A0A7X0RSA2_9BACL|nr:methyltransferase domain-containing protein [Cohnella nanjingensis]MBB6672752.1 methyltransferase domain-containing protein [Cohnella nanjingensis]
MFDRLRERATAPELMDDRAAGGAELREALRHLRRLNRIFGAAGPTLHGVKRLWAEAGQPARWTLLDVGAGSGDVNRRLLRWADRRGVELRIVLLDETAEACDEARRYYGREPRVEVRRGDLFALPPGAADVVTATQVLHHFTGDDMPAAVSAMLRAARVGVVVGDIHRHWIAWSAVWLVTRIVSRNRYIRHDGPLSVAKGFRGADWETLGRLPFASILHYDWRPLFRYAVTIRPAVGKDNQPMNGAGDHGHPL